MDQYINNSQNEPLWTLLANPANDAYLYASNLQALVSEFPQSGILQALLAHTSDEKNLRHASVYFNAKSLYKLINSPSAFTAVPDEKIIIQTGIRVNGHYQKDEHQGAADHQAEIEHETTPLLSNPVTDTQHLEPAPGIEENTAVEELVENKVTDINETAAPERTAPIEHELINDVTAKDDKLRGTVDENPAEGATDAQAGTHTAEFPEQQAEKGISDEIFDEIVGIEHINIEPEANQSAAVVIHEEGLKAQYETTEPSPIRNEKEIKTQDETAGPSPIINGEEIKTQDETAELLPIINQEEVKTQDETAKLLPIINEEEIKTQDETAGPSSIINEEEVKTEDETAELLPIINEEEIKTRDEKVEPSPIINEEEIKTQDEKVEPSTTINKEEEKVIKDNIVSSDFLRFDHAFGENKSAEQEENKLLGVPANTTETAEVKSFVTDDTNHKDVSKYNDEQMPYTFMWWLDKTRKEHAGTYQPYVKPEAVNLNDKPKKAGDELQQQYFENIFHITSVDELDKSTAPPAVPFDIKRKEHKIIERFIKEEPQIKPQSSDKLDNENKAKKSSEDRDELVTETLAAIYSDQMLYHKAIASYKKLILKFPEKSRYFADKIAQLEKKTS